MRAGIYARVSTSDNRQVPENQLAELRRFASTQGWIIHAEYVDHESGGTADRAEFRRMLAVAARHEFDVLLFWSLDRLTREGALETLQYLNRLSSYGVGYRSFTEPYLDSCGLFKDAIVGILATIAKQERVRVSERVRAGLDRAKAQGTRSGRPVGRPRVIVRRDEVVELRMNGHSWRQIARRQGVSVASARRAYCRYSDAQAACQNPEEAKL